MAPRCASERASAVFALAFVAAANANAAAAASTAGARGRLLAPAASQRAAPPGARGDACAAPWAFAGPRGGYVQQSDATKMASASATHAAAAVRTARGERAWLAATVNGGIWRTLDTLGDEATPPHWANVLDGQPVSCASISALTVSELDPKVAFAGCGPSSSSEMGGVDGWDIVNSGHWGGVMVTIDGGDSWSMLTFDTSGASLEGRYVSALEHVDSSTLLVGTRSTLVDKNDGGMFVCTAGGGGEDDAYARARTSTGIPVRCEQTLSKPIYSLVSAGDGQTYVAALAMAEAGAATALSTDGGTSWAMWADGIAWPTGQLPFYPTLAVVRTPDTISVALGALTVDLKTPSRTSSAMFWRDMGASSGAEGAWHPIDMPESLDGDAMPKDRMALLFAPGDDKTLYVAGNADHVAWRVTDWRGPAPSWDSLLGGDTSDGAEPHCDCRNFAWDDESASLLLTSDGGVFRRSAPAQSGGKWTSLVGDIAAIELLSVRYDARDGSWVAGAQDNCVLLGSAAPSPSRALCVEFGDGTLTDIDRSVSPARFFGSTQFLGQVEDDDNKIRNDTFSFGYFEGSKQVPIPLSSTFPEKAFPFFVSPFAVNAVDPEKLMLWAAATESTQGGFYEVAIPHSGPVGKPILRVPTQSTTVFTLLYGRAASEDANGIAALNATHIMHASAKSADTLRAYALPSSYATPVTLNYDKEGDIVLGPVSHDMTVSLAQSPADATLVAVGGWPRVSDNGGEERVFVSADEGRTWVDASSKALVEGAHALLASTTAGVFAAFVEAGLAVGVTVSANWVRVGEYTDLPLVLASGLDYDATSDTLALATMGRGIYTLSGAARALEAMKHGCKGATAAE